MEKIIGLIDAPFTPFHPNGDVNLEPIEAYAKMLQKNGLKGVFINDRQVRAICSPPKSVCSWLSAGCL